MCIAHEKDLKMLEVYLTGGFVIPVVDTFEEIIAILDRDVIGSDDYILLHTREGYRSACRKKDIIGIAEYEE